MGSSALVVLLAPLLFLGMAGLIALGRRIARGRPEESSPRERALLGTIEAAFYALLGLMVAFTYSDSASRFDLRRDQTVAEANAIATAYLRIDLLPPSAQPHMRDLFRRYARERMAVYSALPDDDASDTHAARADALQARIWRDTMAALPQAPPATSFLVVEGLNAMFAITTTRTVYLRTRTPTAIAALLLLLCGIGAALLGYDLPRQRTPAVTIHTAAFALMLTVVLYVIFDLDNPRTGLIRLDYTDQAMRHAIDAMDERGRAPAR